MTWTDYIDDTILGLTIFMTGLPLFTDIVDRTDESKPFIRKITKSGWILIIAGFVMVGLNFLKQKITDSDTESNNTALVNKITTHVDSSLKKYNLKYNSQTQTVDTISTAKVENKMDDGIPLIAFVNAITTNRQNSLDSFFIIVSFRNTGTGDAVNLKDDHYLINQKNGYYSFVKIPKESAATELTTIPKKSDLNWKLPFSWSSEVRDTEFLYVKLEYSDRNLRYQSPTRGIYIIPNTSFPENVSSVNSIMYPSLKTFLIKNGKW